MALIKCSDCNKEVSSSAPSCPHCGNPISATTIEQTGKKWKKMILTSYGLVAFGFFLIFTGYDSDERIVYTILSQLMIWGGVCMWIYAKFSTWWHHK